MLIYVEYEGKQNSQIERIRKDYAGKFLSVDKTSSPYKAWIAFEDVEDSEALNIIEDLEMKCSRVEEVYVGSANESISTITSNTDVSESVSFISSGDEVVSVPGKVATDYESFLQSKRNEDDPRSTARAGRSGRAEMRLDAGEMPKGIAEPRKLENQTAKEKFEHHDFITLQVPLIPGVPYIDKETKQGMTKDSRHVRSETNRIFPENFSVDQRRNAANYYALHEAAYKSERKKVKATLGEQLKKLKEEPDKNKVEMEKLENQLVSLEKHGPEWLHTIANSLGSPLRLFNLSAGTHAANTQMAVIENAIAKEKGIGVEVTVYQKPDTYIAEWYTYTVYAHGPDGKFQYKTFEIDARRGWYNKGDFDRDHAEITNFLKDTADQRVQFAVKLDTAEESSMSEVMHALRTVPNLENVVLAEVKASRISESSQKRPFGEGETSRKGLATPKKGNSKPWEFSKEDNSSLSEEGYTHPEIQVTLRAIRAKKSYGITFAKGEDGFGKIVSKGIDSIVGSDEKSAASESPFSRVDLPAVRQTLKFDDVSSSDTIFDEKSKKELSESESLSATKHESVMSGDSGSEAFEESIQGDEAGSQSFLSPVKQVPKTFSKQALETPGKFSNQSRSTPSTPYRDSSLPTVQYESPPTTLRKDFSSCEISKKVEATIESSSYEDRGNDGSFSLVSDTDETIASHEQTETKSESHVSSSGNYDVPYSEGEGSYQPSESSDASTGSSRAFGKRSSSSSES